ncbi:type II secretion system secretin GspD [Marinobacter gudaonensis]|nr:type II secretion system secretin GspD [Marinobacter gudaonensis]
MMTDIGTGNFVNSDLARERPNRVLITRGKVNLQFNNTDISEVVRTIFGELLNQTYIISPDVKGTVTFSTAKPIARSQLKYVLETFLSWNSAALILREGIYHVVPLDSAVPGHLSPSVGELPVEPGYEVQIVPLKYIAASEMTKLLEPFLTKNALLYADDNRQFLVLAGTLDQLRNYLRTVEIFDVNWLTGMSVGIFPLEVTEPEVIIDELTLLFGAEEDGGALANQIRFMPMARLNAIVAMTSQPEYLKKIKQWTDRLDRQAGQSKEQRLFVYPVNNFDAKILSEILGSLFGAGDQVDVSRGRTEPRRASQSKVAPGLTPVEVSKDGVSTVPTMAGSFLNSPSGVSVGAIDGEPISFTAIEQNNALLIKATASQYRGILDAIRQLDIMPLQVLIEATILEVTLSDGLSYGVEWFLNNAADEFLESEDARGNGFMRAGREGLSYLVGRRNVGVAVSALRQSGKTKLLSSPSLWALNNQAASITVGTQIPVNVTSIDPGGDTDVITSNVQFRDTGVILEVTPRIHPGGLVFLDVALNISNPVGPADSNGNVSIAQRALQTNIAVQGGQAVLLGGLISESGIDSESGVPILSGMPILGELFNSKNRDSTRTEIIAIITPTVVSNDSKSNAIFEEYQRRFQYVSPPDQMKTQPESEVEIAPAKQEDRG